MFQQNNDEKGYYFQRWAGWGIKDTAELCRREQIAEPDILIPMIYRKYDMCSGVLMMFENIQHLKAEPITIIYDMFLSHP